jgi:N-acetylated-alpha-linked acidic dipeptidase
MPRLTGVLAAVALLGLVEREGASRTTQTPGERARLGYSAAASERQRSLEQQFRSAISTDRLSAFHAALTKQPHLAGTPASNAVTDYLRKTLNDAGLDVDVFEYRAYLSFPKSIAVDLIAPVAQALRVTEPPNDLDPDTKRPDLLPGFVAYSASGDVAASIVYVNYGLPADYAQLAARGVDVRGKLVIARYGRSHRAVKVHTAEHAGAAGVLLYSDPADDGFARGETWPRGYWRTENLLQRGNAKYSWFWHGDPLTPGTAARSDGRDPARIDPAAAPTLPRIPVAVLSWGEARKVLERLTGDAAPAGFQGGLPFTYRTGPGDVRVRLRVQMDPGFRTIRDVVARVPGARQADRNVLIGTHHDAWTFGGVDPGSGTAVLLEVARGLGALRRGGWQPHRTIALAFWDAEEFGLIGSTEYAEQWRQQLRSGTICYINTDLYTNGRLDAGGVPSLRDLLVDVAKDVGDGASSVYDTWRADEWRRMPPDRRRRGPGGPGGNDAFEVQLKSLGSGADFVAFQDHVGLPTLSIEFNATGGYTYGAYHSNYDTRWFAEHVADPGFRRGSQLAQVLGSVALRLGEAEVLPFRFSHYAERLAGFVDDIPAWTVDEDGRRVVPLDLRPLESAVGRIASAASALERQIDESLASGRSPSAAPELNDLLARLEQRLLDESEPVERQWYRHVIYGWDIYSLYDGQPFPRLAEAVRSRDRTKSEREVERIRVALGRLEQGLREALVLTSSQGKE